MGLLDGDLSPGTYGLLGALGAMAPTLGYSRLPQSGLQSLALAGAGFGQAYKAAQDNQLLDALRQQQITGLGINNALNNLTLQGYLRRQQQMGAVPPTAAGMISSSSPVTSAMTGPSPVVSPASFSHIGGPGSTPASTSPVVETALKDVIGQAAPAPSSDAALPGQTPPPAPPQPMTQPMPSPGMGAGQPLFSNAELWREYMSAASTPGQQNIAQQILSLIQARIPTGAMPTTNGMAPIPGFLPFQAQNAFASGIGKTIAENNKNETVGPGATLLRGPTTLGDAPGTITGRYTNPNSPALVNLSTAGLPKEFDVIGEGAGKDYNQTIDEGKAAASIVDTIRLARATGAQTGRLAPAKEAFGGWMQAFGFDGDTVKKATDLQKFNAIASNFVLGKQLEQKGVQSESDAQRMRDTFAKITNTEDANDFIMRAAQAQAERLMNKRDFYQAFRTGPDGKPRSVQGVDVAWNKFIRETPIVTNDPQRGVIFFNEFMESAQRKGVPMDQAIQAWRERAGH